MQNMIKKLKNVFRHNELYQPLSFSRFINILNTKSNKLNFKILNVFDYSIEWYDYIAIILYYNNKYQLNVHSDYYDGCFVDIVKI